jgi:hypothetical protein
VMASLGVYLVEALCLLRMYVGKVTKVRSQVHLMSSVYRLGFPSEFLIPILFSSLHLKSASIRVKRFLNYW